MKKSTSSRFKGKKRLHNAMRILTTELCDYGCGEIAKYKFKNRKLCCSEHTSACKKRKQFASNLLNRLYHTIDFLEKRKKGLDMKPNLLEKHMIEILNKLYPDEFKFVGDSSKWIGGKNPDFKHKEKKLIIELFGDYWHSKEVTGIDEQIHEQERQSHFENNGYKTLIIWEREFKNIERLKLKITEFYRKEK